MKFLFDNATILRMERIFFAVREERRRQQELKEAGRFLYTCADLEMTDVQRGLVVGEEYGEVCRAVLNFDGLANDPGKANLMVLRKELVQLAAVTVAWVEALDKISERAEGLQL